MEQSITQELAFLNACLGPRTKFVSSSAEKAWGNYHAACLRHIPAMSERLGLPFSACFHIALNIFEKLVHLKYYTTQSATLDTPNSAPLISDKEKDIVHYIGGCIVRKIENKVCRQKHTKEGHIQILQALKSDKEESATVMSTQSRTATHDRGGLT